MNILSKIFYCLPCTRQSSFDDEIIENTILLPANPNNNKNVIKENKLYVFGNECLGFDNNILNIKEISNTNIKKIVSGDNHVLILFSDGRLFGIGNNTEGQLGLRLEQENLYLTKLLEIRIDLSNTSFSGNKYEILDIAAGNNYSLILVKFNNSNTADVIKFGLNQSDKYSDDLKSLKVVYLISDLYKLNRTNAFGSVKSIYSFGERSLLVFDNEILIGGKDFNMIPLNDYIQLFSSQNKITQISLGKEHCLILDELGNIFSVGDNTYGELGISNMKYSDRPIQIMFFEVHKKSIKKIQCGIRNSFVLLNNGDLYVFGDNSDGQSTGYDNRYLNPFLLSLDLNEGEKVKDIYVGYNHVFIVSNKKNYYTWGSSEGGKLCFNETQKSLNQPKILQNLQLKEINYIYTGKNSTVLSVLNQTI